ncbi:MAG: hypothetical protein ACREFX_03610, partial [Opitutaceae bacterium]
FWLRDTASASTGKILVTVTVWVACVLALGLRLRGRLLARRFAWACVALFVAALASLSLVEQSRGPLPPEPVRFTRT